MTAADSYPAARAWTNERSILRMSAGSATSRLEARVTGSEVVDGHPAAQVLQTADQLAHSSVLIEHPGFGDLDGEPRRIEPRGRESGLHALLYPGNHEFGHREIDKDRLRGAGPQLLVPASQLLAASATTHGPI